MFGAMLAITMWLEEAALLVDEQLLENSVTLLTYVHSRCFERTSIALNSRLAPPGSSWLHLAPPGSSWLPLAPPGSSWLPLAPPWLLLAPPGNSSRPLAPPGST